jgi:hypothetical protein
MAPKISQYFDYELGGKQYKIRYRTPTVGQQISIGQTFAAYKAGFTQLDEVADTLAYATATLNAVIVDKPAELDFEQLDSADWKTLRQMLTDYQSFAFFRTSAPAESSPS